VFKVWWFASWGLWFVSLYPWISHNGEQWVAERQYADLWPWVQSWNWWGPSLNFEAIWFDCFPALAIAASIGFYALVMTSANTVGASGSTEETQRPRR